MPSQPVPGRGCGSIRGTPGSSAGCIHSSLREGMDGYVCQKRKQYESRTGKGSPVPCDLRSVGVYEV